MSTADSIQLKEELDLFRENVKRFVAAEIVPDYPKWDDAQIFPREVWEKMGEHGLLAVDIPEEYGGIGADFHFSMIIQEELQRANCAAISTSTSVHSDIVCHYVLNRGTEAQKQHYLPRLITGSCVGAIAMTEPGTGSDLQAIRATAREDGDSFVINGSKTFITNGQHCDVCIVAAKTDVNVAGSKGITLFLVDADIDGFEKGRNLEKIGLHASDTSELFFQDVRVPKESVLGQIGGGFAVLMGELQRERLTLANGALAAAEGIFEQTIEYVKERKAFGSALSEFQNTKFKVAEMATEIKIHRAFVDECIEKLANGTLDVETVSMAKLSVSEMLGRVTDTCLQLHGGYGYMKEYGVSRAFVDARVQRIYGGTSEIMKELISRSVLGR
jgi:alkylation response protein AidB-like acyl-CoA dehydrogenase